MRTRIVALSVSLALGIALPSAGLVLGAPAATGAEADGQLPAESCKVESINFGMQQGFPGHFSAASSVGTMRAQALFVDFPDHRVDDQDGASIPDYQRIMDRETAALEMQSGGRLDITVETHETWMTLPSPTSEYPPTPGDGWTSDSMTKITTEAIELADPVVDFDGIDVVWVFYLSNNSLARRATADNDLRWEADGRSLTRRVVMPTALFSGTVFHETGHTLGLPDLYDVEASNLPQHTTDASHFIGQWDPMSYADGRPQFTGWTLWRLGWLDDRQVLCVDPSVPTEITLHALEDRGPTALAVVRTERFRGVAIESRHPQSSPDEYADQQAGVLIYVVQGDTTSGQMTAQSADGRERPTDSESMNRITMLPGDRYTDAEGGFTVTVIEHAGASDTVRIEPAGHATEPPVHPDDPTAPTDMQASPAAGPTATLPPTGADPTGGLILSFGLFAVGFPIVAAVRVRRRRSRAE
jgi:M6 family metalloprotease-like protein